MEPLFLKRGYDGVSLNDVVAVVGGSKSTIYSLFGDKEGLLDALVRRFTSEVAVGIEVTFDGPLDQQLELIGRTFLAGVLKPKVLAFHRLMVSVGHSFPAAGRTFFEAGPVFSTSIMAGWIAEHQKAGRLVAGDPYRLARLFHDMLLGEHQLAWLMSYPGAIEPEAIDATVRLATRVFLNGCAIPQTTS